MTTEKEQVSITLKGNLLRDLKRIAMGLEMDLDKCVLTLLKKYVKKEVKGLDKEQDEVFQQMLHDHIHPDLHHNFKSIDDIIWHIAGE